MEPTAISPACPTPPQVPVSAFYPATTVQRFWGYVDKDSACLCHPWEERCWTWTGRLSPNLYGVFDVHGRHMGAHRFAYQAEQGILPTHIYVLHQPPCILKHCVRHLYAGSPQDNSNDAKNMERFPTGHQHAALRDDYANLPRGDKHWTHKAPEKLLRGNQHWTHISPEKVVRGLLHKEKHREYSGLPRGEDHARLHNNYVALPRGDKHPQSRFQTADILAIRMHYRKGMTIYALAKHYHCAYPTIKRIVHYITWKHVP